MWQNKQPVFGDHIRVCRGLYYHHGIYAADSCVIHFASAASTDTIDPANAKIITTSLDEFLKGGQLEVRAFSDLEMTKKRTSSEIVNYALMRVGEGLGTYNLINNNCEHFANECLFGKKESQQVENVMSMLFGGMR